MASSASTSCRLSSPERRVVRGPRGAGLTGKGRVQRGAPTGRACPPTTVDAPNGKLRVRWDSMWANGRSMKRSMKTAIAEHSAVAIWYRAIQPEVADLTSAQASAVLRLRLAPADLGRADDLASKARQGKLAAREERELEDYLAVGSALEFLKSKARLALKKARVAA